MFRLLIPVVRLLGVLGIVAIAAAAAAEEPNFTLRIKNHVFEPAELTVPANTRIKLIVKNEDPTPEEFESLSLRREKVVKGNSEIVVNIGPLAPGRYEYFGEFNPKTARGAIVAK